MQQAKMRPNWPSDTTIAVGAWSWEYGWRKLGKDRDALAVHLFLHSIGIGAAHPRNTTDGHIMMVTDMISARNGWDLNPRAIDLDDKNLFVGTVEMFDQSLVLLEEWLKQRNLEFDASYGFATNTGSRTGSKKPDFFTDSVFPDMIEVDELLWKEASRRIEFKISSDLKFKDKMADFERRREAVTGLLIPQKGPEDFVRL